MNKILLLLLATGLTNKVFSQINPTGCNSFRTGIFAYKDSSNALWEIKRTRHYQTETNKKSGIQVKNKIKWLSDCEYRITQQWANNKERRKLNRQQSTIRIIKTNPDSYEYTCSCTNGGGNESKGLVVKISD